jgi:hypothetical protein
MTFQKKLYIKIIMAINWKNEADNITDTTVLFEELEAINFNSVESTNTESSFSFFDEKDSAKKIDVFVTTLNASEAKQAFNKSLPSHHKLSYGEMQSGEDFQSSENGPPQTESGRLYFGQLIKELIMDKKIPEEQKQQYVSEVYQTYICPTIITNDDLFKSMSGALGLAAALSGGKTLNIAKKFLNRYKENNDEDFFDTQDAADLLWTKSNQGKNMLKKIAELFHQHLPPTDNDKQFMQNISDHIKNINGVIDIVKPNIKDVAILLAVIGGTQGLIIHLTKLRIQNFALKIYEAELKVFLCDDFGVEESDWGKDNILEGFFNATHHMKDRLEYRRSLVAFWVLQHQRNIKPFRTVVSFNLKISVK